MIKSSKENKRICQNISEYDYLFEKIRLNRALVYSKDERKRKYVLFRFLCETVQQIVSRLVFLGLVASFI